MSLYPVNYLVLLLAVLLRAAIGWLWYSPAVFFHPWRRLAGLGELTLEQMQAGMGRGVLINFAADFAMAFVMVNVVRYAGAVGPLAGAVVGFFLWLGFVFSVQIATANPEKRPYRLIWINSGYQLVSMVVMGAVLATRG